jgi:hypothetical protein
MSKTKTESGPRWAILNENFALSPAENEVVNRHNDVWREHCQGSKATDAPGLEQEFRSLEMDASHGDEKALETLRTFGTLESFTRFRRAEQTGRRARFDRDNAGLFVETHAIAKRLREGFEKLLKQYREGGEDERKLLGLSPIIRDDCTALLERQIATLFAAESHTPAVFETLGNHVALIETEEEQP